MIRVEKLELAPDRTTRLATVTVDIGGVLLIGCALVALPDGAFRLLPPLPGRGGLVKLHPATARAACEVAALAYAATGADPSAAIRVAQARREEREAMEA